MSGEPTGGVAAGRDEGVDIAADDWVEQDLLTRDLAADRLTALEAETRAALADLRATARPDAAAVDVVERKLRAIEASRRTILDGSDRSR
mgnify:CR=1 FL=1